VAQRRHRGGDGQAVTGDRRPDLLRVIDRSSDIILIVRDGTVVHANPAAHAALMYPPGALAGVPALDLAVAAERDEARQRIEATVAGGSLGTVERQLVRSDGSLLVVETVTFPTEIGGAPVAVLIGRDLTAARKVEERERLLRAIYDVSPVAIMLHDSGGRVVEWNDAAARMFDWPKRGAQPRDPPPDTGAARGISDALCRSAAEHGFAELDTGPVYTQGGRAVFLHGVAAPVRDRSGQISGFVQLSVDTTATMQAAEAARRAETMAQLGALLAGVAHQVRNPLFGISAGIDALEAWFGKEAAAAPLLRALRWELGRLNGIMTALLEYGKPPSNVRVRDRLSRVVDIAVRCCDAVATRRGVTIDDRTPSNDAEILVDPERLAQAFENLLENAAQHAPPGSHVTVEACRTTSPTGGAVEVRGVDCGPGLGTGGLPRVFEPFYSNRRGGTGLGLPIVQRIVEEQGGTVSVSNRSEGGAAVAVVLPLAPEQRAGSDHRDSASDVSQGATW
jgi:PAS domain S-box-containing protein